MRKWQVQEAKARLSEVLEKAHSEGPQTITKHGADNAVVLSMEEYRRITKPTKSFIEHLLSGPKIDDFDIPPNDDTPREVDLSD